MNASRLRKNLVYAQNADGLFRGRGCRDIVAGCSKRLFSKAAASNQNMILPSLLAFSLGMEADDLLCSRNARPEKALVERAQWKINQPPSLTLSFHLPEPGSAER